MALPQITSQSLHSTIVPRQKRGNRRKSILLKARYSFFFVCFYYRDFYEHSTLRLTNHTVTSNYFNYWAAHSLSAFRRSTLRDDIPILKRRLMDDKRTSEVLQIRRSSCDVHKQFSGALCFLQEGAQPAPFAQMDGMRYNRPNCSSRSPFVPAFLIIWAS